MRWFDDLKFKSKFMVVMGLLACIMVAFAVHTVTQTDNIQGDILKIVSYQQQQIHIADAMVNAHGFTIGNLVRGY